MDQAKLEAFHRAACSFAADRGLHVPTMDEVVAAERYARGSADYGSKWALVLAEKITPTADV